MRKCYFFSTKYFLRMKYLILFALISLGTCTTILRYDHESQWQEYKLTYKKEYKTSNDELKRYLSRYLSYSSNIYFVFL